MPPSTRSNPRQPVLSPGKQQAEEHARGFNNNKGDEDQPAFEIVVLGSGGGPLETDCAGYLVKPYGSKWEDGVLGVEGGSGLGALATLLSTRKAKDLFPGVVFPRGINTPLLKASYIFSFLSSYVITHSHMDHVLSLVMLTGSFPCLAPEPTSAPTQKSDPSLPSLPASSPKPPTTVYGTKGTLKRFSMAYKGALWPELADFDPNSQEANDPEPISDMLWDYAIEGGDRQKKRKLEELAQPNKSSYVAGAPVLPTSRRSSYAALDPASESALSSPGDVIHPCLTLAPLATTTSVGSMVQNLPLSIRPFPLLHGATSQGEFESSAFFIRHVPPAHSSAPPPQNSNRSPNSQEKEFLFLGDMESAYRRPGEETVDKDRAVEAGKMNRDVWTEAAKSWDEGRLSGVFLECSYDSSRPAQSMYGHISPPGLYYELKTLASLVQSKDEKEPLRGLKVFVIHIKESLLPNAEGKTQREIVMRELRQLEEDGKLGVILTDPKRGDRLVI
ncbi:hypothetical protein B9479_004899 [Cryptococcus floricola]|uniref:3',5'-cyclic-nucleotide phosphodiesterase n=1 Tax=Cryptococcus floricola TaxID=2591691 RepID=A0A5D3AW48_9TREE|nr:hypothetical protein B9479_004899 [Cryptococcus floricola]